MLRMILFPIIPPCQKRRFITKPEQNNPLRCTNIKSRFKEVFSIRLNTADCSTLILLVPQTLFRSCCTEHFVKQVIANATCHCNIVTASVKCAPGPQRGSQRANVRPWLHLQFRSQTGDRQNSSAASGCRRSEVGWSGWGGGGRRDTGFVTWDKNQPFFCPQQSRPSRPRFSRSR